MRTVRVFSPGEDFIVSVPTKYGSRFVRYYIGWNEDRPDQIGVPIPYPVEPVEPS